MASMLPQTLQTRQLISKATSDDENLTAGYLYNDISKLTFKNETVQDVEDQLLKRLEKNSPHVKFKALRVIKHACEQGHPVFKRDLQRKTNAIRACLHFRGEPHPMLGDTPNRLVRETAQEVMTAIFDTESKAPDNGSTSRMAGFGSSDQAAGAPYGGGGPYECGGSSMSSSAPPPMGMSSSSRMQGFGNPNFVQKTAPDSALDKGLEAAKSIGSSVLKAASDKFGPKPLKGSNGSGMFASSSQWSANAYDSPSTSSGFGGQSGFASQSSQSAGWGQSTSYEQSSSTYDDDDYSIKQSSGLGADQGAYENKLVEEACAPGGVRAALTPAEVAQFCAKCTTLNNDLVAELLDAKLGASSWQTRLKALCVLEGVLKSPSGTPFSCYFSENSAALHHCATSSQSSVRDKATKILRLFGHDDAQGQGDHGHAPEPQSRSHVNAQASGSFFEFDDAPSQPPPPQVPGSSSEDAGGMFAGLSLAGPASTGSAQPAPTAPMMRQQQVSLIDDVPAPSPPTSHATATEAAQGLDLSELERELLSTTGTAPTPAPPAKPSPMGGMGRAMPVIGVGLPTAMGMAPMGRGMTPMAAGRPMMMPMAGGNPMMMPRVSPQMMYADPGRRMSNDNFSLMRSTSRDGGRPPMPEPNDAAATGSFSFLDSGDHNGAFDFVSDAMARATTKS